MDSQIAMEKEMAKLDKRKAEVDINTAKEKSKLDIKKANMDIKKAKAAAQNKGESKSGDNA
jgi:hypothetical protein